MVDPVFKAMKVVYAGMNPHNLCVHLLCILFQAPCNIFTYLKVFGLLKVVEGFGLLESSDNSNPQHTFLSVVHWEG